MGAFVGKPIKRREDARFLKGAGKYTDDLKLHGMTQLAFVRSPFAHAKILSVDTSKALQAKGVVAVYTAADGCGEFGVPCGWQVDFKNGETMREPVHPLLAKDKIRHVGEAVAAVVAETLEEARDAAELVEVDYDPLPAVTDPEKAMSKDAPLVHDQWEDNAAFDWCIGNDRAEVEAALAGAHHVTEMEFRNQRLAPNAIEPRSYISDYDVNADKWTLYTSTQNPHLIRLLLCAFVLGIPEHKVRVVSHDVGGGFGSKIYHYTEEALVTWISREIGRPVKWTADRSEAFLTDAHGRDHMVRAKMGFDKEGKILGILSDEYCAMGAYLSTFAPAVPTYLHGTLFQGVYTTPLIHLNVTAPFTHTVPVDAYRGAGRPEATYLLERIISKGAQEMGIDAAEIRFKNFIPPFDGVNQEGYQTQVALQYDSGNYEATLKRGLEMLGYEDFRKEQEKARNNGNGKLLGVGISTYIEGCGIAPSAVVGALGARAGLYEVGQVRVQPTGKVSVYTGAHSHGQGHETVFAQFVADALGIPMDDVEIEHGDTEQVAFGMGTYGSRSLAVGGSAIIKSIEKILEKGAKIAAHKLEASEADLEYADGKWTVKGTDKSISFGDVSLTAYVPHDYPEGLEPGLDFSSFYDPTNFTYPFGTHIAVVEVDKETGKVDLKRFVACDDVGNVMNPMIVDGQIHGGIAQGVGQALLEEVIYDDQGQMISGSYMDYALPRADDLPMIETDRTVTPCPHNPLGVKGAGEAGAIGSTPAVVNAVVDALSHLGVTDIQMPLTPQRVWKAMQN
ncbi:xanthine dehydrogenase family protein molybdopterin-binding subunit [Poritiphilus flavus]|uniref:Molybdopterin-dependent oxidoreductase n=1 Tax=Poritiphilus flavus TaxID=2697053 RepID=A0A6L9EA90_9FLAO|nr:molybdopterin cofactor-binding domain-containing protein [Poritiphilus flavus]NAS11584.1 molybdopterin-dependent oxidoreductase [Poritiphilus flavus]